MWRRRLSPRRRHRMRPYRHMATHHHRHVRRGHVDCRWHRTAIGRHWLTGVAGTGMTMCVVPAQVAATAAGLVMPTAGPGFVKVGAGCVAATGTVASGGPGGLTPARQSACHILSPKLELDTAGSGGPGGLGVLPLPSLTANTVETSGNTKSHTRRKSNHMAACCRASC